MNNQSPLIQRVKSSYQELTLNLLNFSRGLWLLKQLRNYEESYLSLQHERTRQVNQELPSAGRDRLLASQRRQHRLEQTFP